MVCFSWRRSSLRTLVLAVATLVALQKTLWLVEATQAYPYTNDQVVNTQVASASFFGLEAFQVDNFCNSNNYRLTQIRVEDPSIPTFSGAVVQNVDDYYIPRGPPGTTSGWYWQYNLINRDVGTAATNNRLICLEPYVRNGVTQFAIIVIPNSGKFARNFFYYLPAAQPNDIISVCNANNARPTSIRPYKSGASVLYAALLIGNSGVDYVPSYWWFASATTSDIYAKQGTGMRVISIALNPGGGFAAVLVASEGEVPPDYLYNYTKTNVQSFFAGSTARITDMSTYLGVDNSRQYAIAWFDNGNPRQAPINALSTTVRSHAESNGWFTGYHGHYFLESTDTSPQALVADNSQYTFEPTGSLSVLYLLYTLKNNIDLNSQITYYWTAANQEPTASACPLDVPETAANARTTTVQHALTGMISNGNNIYRRAFAIKYGLTAVNNLASSVGMGYSAIIDPNIGCGFRPQPGVKRNRLRLYDIAQLYNSVDRSRALTGTQRSLFFSNLPGGQPAAGSAWDAVVRQEAAKLGKSATFVTSFLAQTEVRSTPYIYTYCMAGDCSSHKLNMNYHGRLVLPFQSGPKSFIFANFAQDLALACAPTGVCASAPQGELWNSAAESARQTVNQALASYP